MNEMFKHSRQYYAINAKSLTHTSRNWKRLITRSAWLAACFYRRRISWLNTIFKTKLAAGKTFKWIDPSDRERRVRLGNFRRTQTRERHPLAHPVTLALKEYKQVQVFCFD